MLLRIRKNRFSIACLTLLLLTVKMLAPPQSPAQAYSRSSVADLPDAPRESNSIASSIAGTQAFGNQTAVGGVASVYDRILEPGETAPRLTVRNKIAIGFRDSVSPFAMLGWIGAAGYSQAVDNSPNYGQDGKAFAQRLGAASARNTSQYIISESILAPVLHQDSRYYRLGKGHSFIKRVLYSGSRAIITRTDGGHQTVNISLIGGNLGGAAITPLYYPPGNRNFNQILQTFGGSMGGSALGNVIREFVRGTGFLVAKQRKP